MRLAIREIRLLKASSHPNVVQLFEAFKSKSGRVYMVMELVDRSLTEEIRKHPMGFAPDKLKVVTWQLLQATAFLHSNNVRQQGLEQCCSLMGAHTHCSPHDGAHFSTSRRIAGCPWLLPDRLSHKALECLRLTHGFMTLQPRRADHPP